jgi:hypothetical protein
MKQVGTETVDWANPVGCSWVTLARENFHETDISAFNQNPAPLIYAGQGSTIW